MTAPSNRAELDQLGGYLLGQCADDHIRDPGRHWKRLRTELESHGVRLVPVEPIDAQLQNAHDGALGADDHLADQKVKDWLAEMYRDYLAASPFAPEDKP